MSHDPLPPLDDALQGLLEKAAPVVPPPGFADQVWAGLDRAPLGAAPVAAVGLTSAKLLIAGALAAAVGAGAGIAVDRAFFRPEPEPRVVVRELVKEVVKEVRVEVPVEVRVPVPAPVAAKGPDARPTAVASPDAQLREERALLEVARTALARRDAAGALAQLEAHARRFPSGRLAEERDALEVTALDGAGQREAATEKARAFLQRYPDSLLRPQVRRFAEP
jgi:hypothetical protein